ncbi:hypothetical protein UY3_03139 [Chelonia mydas]|uniref:Uncharacterized protein n=1 Tax=Chelonia mydas TaxID=8469 RepID=M7BUY7_CHEMY|nr:hypothetical protein UY3_03139 [Chelonia mydas]
MICLPAASTRSADHSSHWAQFAVPGQCGLWEVADSTSLNPRSFPQPPLAWNGELRSVRAVIGRTCGRCRLCLHLKHYRGIAAARQCRPGVPKLGPPLVQGKPLAGRKMLCLPERLQNAQRFCPEALVLDGLLSSKSSPWEAVDTPVLWHRNSLLLGVPETKEAAEEEPMAVLQSIDA